MKKITRIRKIIGNNVKYYRYLIGYTQEQLGEECDLSTRYISDIENSQGNIALDTLEKIAGVLGVEPYKLIKQRENQKLLPKKVNMKK